MSTAQRQHLEYQYHRAKRLGNRERAEQLAERLGLNRRRAAV